MEICRTTEILLKAKEDQKLTFAAIVHEKFGDGIMSAVDFTMDLEREKNPEGDRIKVTMSGKYLPYKIW